MEEPSRFSFPLLYICTISISFIQGMFIVVAGTFFLTFSVLVVTCSVAFHEATATLSRDLGSLRGWYDLDGRSLSSGEKIELLIATTNRTRWPTRGLW